MKKRFFAIIALLAVALLALTGCSDFAFNPIGRWHPTEIHLYEDGKLVQTTPIDQNGDIFDGGIYDNNIPIEFKKNGTGAVISASNIPFTYEYTDEEVRIESISPDGKKSSSVYYVSDGGNALTHLVQEGNYTDDKGKTHHYEEIWTYRR